MPKLHRGLIPLLVLASPSLSAPSAPVPDRKEKPPAENIVIMEKFVAGGDGFDSASMIPKDPVGSVFGLAKLPIETPRSISVLSSDMLKINNIVELQDLQRFIPGSWTAPSFVQGSVSVRGDGADVYYNGMKRLANSGGFPTIIGATDGVNIVKGPPSAVFGPGQVGGYMDYIPKSARASTGKYLTKNTGSVSFEAGSYNYFVASAELGGPLTVFGRPAGFYLFARAEDSESYYVGKFQKDQIVQGTLSTNLTADAGVRMQVGFNFQNNRGTGVSGWNRVTQELIDHGTYEVGTPLFNMDTNNDGFISAAEIAANPMVFTIPWATAQAARAGGPLPALPRSFALDPATIGTVQLDGRQVLLERFLMAYDYMAFADIVHDRNPNLVFKLKGFSEYQKREKFSDTSTAQNNFSFLAASTGIVEYKPVETPRWLKLQTLAALNWRWVDTYSNSNLLHQIYPRIDIWRNPGAAWQPNWIVANYLDHPELMGRQTVIEDNHVEYGGGLILDLTFFERVNVMFNQRKDFLWADVVQTRNNFNAVYDRAVGTDDASSWSASLSVQLTRNIRPYITYADGQTYLPGTGSAISGPGPVRFGALQTPSTLKEGGIKMSFFKDSLFLTLAGYEQFRSALVSFPDGSNTQQQTRSTGAEVDLRWVPAKEWTVTAIASWNHLVLDPVTAVASYRIPVKWTGYGSGNWAGILNTTLPASSDYAERSGRPDHVFGLNVTRRFGRNFDLGAGANYQTGYSVGDLKEFTLPDAFTFNFSGGYSSRTWDFRVSGTNLTNTRYFTANLNTSTLVMPMPMRQFRAKVSYKF